MCEEVGEGTPLLVLAVALLCQTLSVLGGSPTPPCPGPPGATPRHPGRPGLLCSSQTSATARGFPAAPRLLPRVPHLRGPIPAPSRGPTLCPWSVWGRCWRQLQPVPAAGSPRSRGLWGERGVPWGPAVGGSPGTPRSAPGPAVGGSPGTRGQPAAVCRRKRHPRRAEAAPSRRGCAAPRMCRPGTKMDGAATCCPAPWPQCHQIPVSASPRILMSPDAVVSAS